MPLLLEEDGRRPLPRMYRVRQSFCRDALNDVEGTVQRELRKPEIAGQVKPGMNIALAVGSRGIRNLSRIVKAVVDELLAMGAKPFILAAMGSHGSGTLEGQLEILHTYGITEQAMGVPVIANNDVIHLGETSRGIQVWFDAICLNDVDLIIPINRIKLHTDFVDTIQSGMCKMLVIGLGHHKGCTAIHESEFAWFGETLKEAVQIILDRAKVGFGIGIIENAYDQTARIEAVPADNLLHREEELVEIAKSNMPRLMIPDIDVLVVGQIGKDISGAGYDPNILGRSSILDRFVLPVPTIRRMILLDVSEASHGNAIGMGMFDIITRKVFDQLDLESIYTNCISIKVLDDCKIPLIAADEAEAIRIAIQVLRGHDPNRLKIVKIQDTLHLEEIQVSEDLLDVVRADEHLELLGPVEA
ncbi:MAG: lactate racemase domain-containing protein [Butyricicoccus sp.]